MTRISSSRQEAVTVLSWNVNGIRSACRKGIVAWLKQKRPDILCLQEIRARETEVEKSLFESVGYCSYWNGATRAGYGGTAILSLRAPMKVTFGIGDPAFDAEGRTVIAEFPEFVLVNSYFPNGNRSQLRLLEKLRFYGVVLDKCDAIRRQGKQVIVCGDLNTAHKEMDLVNPAANKSKSGFLPEERAWIDRMIDAGYIDTFRYLYPTAGNRFTWWSYTCRSWERNRGWRFDYIFASRELIRYVQESFIMSSVRYSDHCPIGIRLAVD
jgi:exodeoxyribonuclease-3